MLTLTKITIANEEAISLWNAILGLHAVTKTTKAVKFAFARTRRSIQDLVEALTEQTETHRREMIDLAEEYAEIDAAGKPVRNENGYRIDQTRRKEYFTRLDAKNKELRDLMKTHVEVEVLLVPWAALADNIEISEGGFDGLYPILTGEPPTIEPAKTPAN